MNTNVNIVASSLIDKLCPEPQVQKCSDLSAAITGCFNPACVEPDIDYYGNDIVGVKEKFTTYGYEDCGCICQFTKECNAWAWSLIDDTCYLKSSTAGRTHDPYSISGTLTC